MRCYDLSPYSSRHKSELAACIFDYVLDLANHVRRHTDTIDLLCWRSPRECFGIYLPNPTSGSFASPIGERTPPSKCRVGQAVCVVWSRRTNIRLRNAEQRRHANGISMLRMLQRLNVWQFGREKAQARRCLNWRRHLAILAHAWRLCPESIVATTCV